MLDIMAHGPAIPSLWLISVVLFIVSVMLSYEMEEAIALRSEGLPGVTALISADLSLKILDD